MRRFALASLIVGAAVSAEAQRGPACAKPSESAPWMLVQKQTLSEEDGAWKNDSLRKVLMRAAKMTSPAVAPQLGWEKPTAPDTVPNDVTTSLRTAPRGSPWPTKSVVGIAGVRALFTLAHQDTAFARVALRRMMESGLDEALKPDVAVLEDRVRLMSGRKQLYGTQLITSDGRFVPAAIEDSAHVDLRREGANLPPLAWSVCNANSR